MDSTIEVIVDTAIGTFSIRVDMWDTVLTMKQKIEKSQRIPVSKQTLYFNTKVLDDNLYIMQCKIFNNSRLLLAIPPDFNPNQNNNPVMVNDQVLPQNEPPLHTTESVEEFLMNDSPETMEGKDHQLLHQTEQSFAETIYSQDQVLSDISKIQTKDNIQDHYPTTTDPTKQSPSNTPEEIKDDHQDSTKTDKKDQSLLSNSGINIQDSPVKFPVGSKRSNKNNSLRSNSSQELRATQDLPPVPAGNKGIKTKQSPKPVSFKRRNIITPDSPERKRSKRMEFTVMVQPFKEEPHKEETRKIPVNVFSDEKVEELREKVAKLKEMGELDLPEEGYFFIHEQHVLTDHHTFEENLVAPGDTIEIFRGSVTLCD